LKLSDQNKAELGVENKSALGQMHSVTRNIIVSISNQPTIMFSDMFNQ
jgi:hypothetical protein